MVESNRIFRTFGPGKTPSVIAVLLLCGASPFQDPDPNQTIGPQIDVVRFDLSTAKGNLVYLDGERLVIDQGESVPRTLNPIDIAFITIVTSDKRITTTPDPTRGGRIWTTDGSYYSTEPIIRGETLIWKNDLVGEVSATLDEVIAFSTSSSEFPDSSPSDDLVILENGDRIGGLVVELGRNIQVEEANGSLIDIPIERITSVALINDPSPRSGARMWSVDGDRIWLDSYRYEPGFGLIFGQNRNHVPVLPGRVLAFTHDIDRLIPLADLPVEARGLEEQLRYHHPPPVIEEGIWPFDAPPMLLSGPIRLQWEMPKPDLSLIASAILPAASRRYGSVELVISDDSGELFRRVITADDPECDIRLDIRGRKLTMELHENGDGPLQDMIRLERAILIDAPSGN